MQLLSKEQAGQDSAPTHLRASRYTHQYSKERVYITVCRDVTIFSF